MKQDTKDIFQVAIDGPTASGKGTVAKLLARRFGWLCLDTGALYRGIAIHFMMEGLRGEGLGGKDGVSDSNNINDGAVDINDAGAVLEALGRLDLDVKCEGGETLVFLGGVDVTKRLHDIEVSEFVYKIAALPPVRARVKEIQQRIGNGQTIVCEGRDITSVIFPNARFKFYLTASLRARAKRRYREEVKKGVQTDDGCRVTMERVMEGIRARDYADMTREISPLVRVRDAVVIDCSRRTAYDVVEIMEGIITSELRKG